MIPSFTDGQPAPIDIAHLAEEWLHHEATGARLRLAHRCIEWDGWEEGLVESILGPEEQEDDWFKSWEDKKSPDGAPAPVGIAADVAVVAVVALAAEEEEEEVIAVGCSLLLS